MVAINGALSVDLTGQIASESIGPRMYTGSGGQPSFAIGSMLSKGGRSIIMLRSTSNDGNVSRITSCLDAGTIVTVPRNFADYIVTEFGIASLLGKSQRERAQELIAIAHPDFRSELERQARKLFWP
jgi:acyl-CoA hydrolase